MTVRRLLVALGVALTLGAFAPNALAGGRPSGMSPAAYRAIMIRSAGLNKLYGNAVTRLTPAQFITLYDAGGWRMTPDELNALVVRSEGMNRLAESGAFANASPAVTAEAGFAWADFSYGIAAALGCVLLVGGVRVAGRNGRKPSPAARIGS